MNPELLFDFNTSLSGVTIPLKLNNPFGKEIPEIAKIASSEFQEYILTESRVWNYDFLEQKGKMFGVLVVQNPDSSYAYLGTVSGNLPRRAICNKFVPPIFDESTDQYFLRNGMIELTKIGTEIKKSTNTLEIAALKEKRSLKSKGLQKRLFDNYHFLNLSGKEKSLLEIFKVSTNRRPPSAAGECTAPKLLQYALKYGLKPIALAEFWWGNTIKGGERKHKMFYAACLAKCKPILEYMLEDEALYELALSNNNCI